MAKKTTVKSTASTGAPDFEQSLSELEQLVEKMEKGDLSLEQALADFQRGIELTRQCQQTLKAAEQKVQILMDQGDKGVLAPFDTDTEN